MLRQFTFCKRIPYFAVCIGLRPKSPLWVVQGKSYELMRQCLLKARMPQELNNLGPEKLEFNIFLSSDELGLHGAADAIIETAHGPAVLELKANPGKLNRGSELQLAAYSILLEKQRGVESSHAYFVQGKPIKVTRFKINQELRDDVYSTTRRIQEIVGGGTLPDSDAEPAKCAQCEYLNFCNDRD